MMFMFKYINENLKKNDAYLMFIFVNKSINKIASMNIINYLMVDT